MSLFSFLSPAVRLLMEAVSLPLPPCSTWKNRHKKEIFVHFTALEVLVQGQLVSVFTLWPESQTKRKRPKFHGPLQGHAPSDLWTAHKIPYPKPLNTFTFGIIQHPNHIINPAPPGPCRKPAQSRILQEGVRTEGREEQGRGDPQPTEPC